MKEKPDINDTLKADGVDAVRARHDRAVAYRSSCIGSNAEKKPVAGAPSDRIREQGEGTTICEESGADRPVSIDDFYAYMPTHRYMFMPTRELWPASSVNARIGRVLVVGEDNEPVLDKTGNKTWAAASTWLDQHRSVEQMTWAPGQEELISNRLIAEGGWINRPNANCLNLYRPATIELGRSDSAGPWLDHLKKIYPSDASHILNYLAHRSQRPHEKINHALLLGGDQGIGKDTLLEPVKQAIGPWNFSEVSPQNLMGRFNGFLKAVILRISEARDLGDVNQFGFYEHMKTLAASPPDVLRCDEKNLREHAVMNVCGIIITTNHLSDGIFLPADDRRHYVAWSSSTKDDFTDRYWGDLWRWYESGGFSHVAALLAEWDLSAFSPKVPPAKTAAFWTIVDANCAPEEAELADVFDRMGNPEATTIARITAVATGDILGWLSDRKNRRAIPHRLDRCGYTAVRNHTKDGLWVINGDRQTVYAKAALSISDRYKAVNSMIGNG